MAIELPEMDEAEIARHAGLLARGYRFFGWDGLAAAHLYERRFREREEQDGGKCCLHLFRYPPFTAEVSRRWYTYAAEIYFETEFGAAGKLYLYAFAADELMERLPAIEAACLDTWERLRRK